MKTIQIFLITILSFGLNLCFGQTDQTKKESTNVQIKSKLDKPYYVVKVNEKSLEIDASKNENFDLASIDPNAIESVSVLKGDEAKNKFGDKGQSGVVIITVKNFDLLSKELQAKFVDLDKK